MELSLVSVKLSTKVYCVLVPCQTMSRALHAQRPPHQGWPKQQSVHTVTEHILLLPAHWRSRPYTMRPRMSV